MTGSSENLDAFAARTPSHGLRGISLLLLLLLLLLATRLYTWQHPVPVDVDETSFIAGLGFPVDYPVHHPGYPLWVGLGTLGSHLGLKAYSAFAIWSLLASLIAPLLFYVGLRRILDDGLAWWLAVGFGVNPLVWFHSTTALSYLAGGMLGLWVVGLCWRAMTRESAPSLIWASLVMAIALWLRPDNLIYLGPMLAYVAWRLRHRGGWIPLLIPALALAAYLVTTSYLYGRNEGNATGPNLAHTLGVIFGTSAFKLGMVDGVLRNAIKIVVNLAWDFGPALAILPLAIAYLIKHRKRLSPLPLFMLFWAAPLLSFLLLMHVVQGYCMLLIPAGFCAIGVYLQKRHRRTVATGLAILIAACSFTQFALYPWSAESVGWKRLLDAKIAFQSASGLRQIDRRSDIHNDGDFWRTAAHNEPDKAETTTGESNPSEP